MALLASLLLAITTTTDPTPATARWTIETVENGFLTTDHRTLTISSDGRYEFGPRTGTDEYCRPKSGTVAHLAAFDSAVRSAWSEPWALHYENKKVLDGSVLLFRLVGYDDGGHVIAKKTAIIENPRLPGAELLPPGLRSLKALSAPYAVCESAKERPAPGQTPY